MPSKDTFYSRLKSEAITDEDYKHAIEVWDEFEMKTLREYDKLYNKTAVLLLADVFENFRDVCLENYGLDPVWYYTCLLYTSPSPRDRQKSRMPSSA